MQKYSQKSLIGRVEREIKQNSLIVPGDTIIVALSGGPDSVCLLDILDQLKARMSFSLVAAHFNHRMRGAESDADEKFVKKFCTEREIRLFIGRAGKKEYLSSENEARIARYRFFEKILQEGRGTKVALAHNCNDLTETVIFRLVRGTGLSGLRGIPLQREKFFRPLLPFLKSEIEGYLKEKSLPYRIDSSNLDPKYSRNFIRLRVLPLLTELNPDVITTIRSAARRFEDDYAFIEDAAKRAFQTLLLNRSSNEIVLDQSGWIVLHPALQTMVLRHAIKQIVPLFDITSEQIEEITQVIKRGEGNKHKILPHSLRAELRDGTIRLVAGNNSSGTTA